VTVDPQVQKYLKFFPIPNGQIISNGDLGIYSVAEQQIISENFLTIRVDHKFSDKDDLFGTYVYDKTPLTTPDNFGHRPLRFFSSALVNSMRFGFNRDFANVLNSLKAINPAVDDTSLAAVPGHNAAALVVGVTGASLFRWNSLQGYDDAFFIRGLHSLKFGVAVERDQLNELVTNVSGGEFHFGSLL
jgi:hypothetical protein